MNYPEKKGYSPRNLTYMCQFSRIYPLEVLQKLLSCDMELLKAPYIFDIANAKESADERDIEKQLVEHITKYLLEMGNGFAFVARQKHFQVGSSDSYADLILYNIKLHTYIVVGLKATPFKPKYAGQLNFYINVVDDQMRGENDGKTIGLLLCRGKDEVVAQYALTGYAQPIGVSDYQLSKTIPGNLESSCLPLSGGRIVTTA